MPVRIDHVVLWVADPLRSVEFYTHVLGFEAERLEEFRRGEVPFPSVRLAEDALLDLMPRTAAPGVDAMVRAPGSAGSKLNHLCLSMSKAEYTALRARLDAHGVPVPAGLRDSFGARGLAPETIYFEDPDGNVLEARYYT